MSTKTVSYTEKQPRHCVISIQQGICPDPIQTPLESRFMRFGGLDCLKPARRLWCRGENHGESSGVRGGFVIVPFCRIDLDLGISAAGIPLVRTQGNRGLTDDESLSIIRVLEAAS